MKKQKKTFFLSTLPVRTQKNFSFFELLRQKTKIKPFKALQHG